MTELILSLVLVHLVVDFFFQNDYMATNKMKWVWVGGRRCHLKGCPGTYSFCSPSKGFPLPHIAGIWHAWLHATWTFIALGLMYITDVSQVEKWDALAIALTIGALHWLIDLRFLLAGWRKVANQTTDPNNPASLHVAIWQDQIAHVLVIVAAVNLLA